MGGTAKLRMAQESLTHASTTSPELAKNAVVATHAVMDRAIIGENAEIYDSIIGRHVVVNSSCINPQKSPQSQ